MKIDKVDHVGIAVKDIDATLKFYKENLGVKKEDIEDVTAAGMMRLVLGLGTRAVNRVM
jgi:catechol 2,3-dioxygenase-like lactoylglutathione lyase family enzyme